MTLYGNIKVVSCEDRQIARAGSLRHNLSTGKLLIERDSAGLYQVKGLYRSCILCFWNLNGMTLVLRSSELCNYVDT